MATGCDDHTARIWSLASGEQSGEPFYLRRASDGGPTTAGRGNALLVGGIEDTEVKLL